jgi:hypothetical protein
MGKPSVGQHSPISSSIIKGANVAFRSMLATMETVFANKDEMICEIKTAFLRACEDTEAPQRMARFHGDQLYAEHMLNIVSAISS